MGWGEFNGGADYVKNSEAEGQVLRGKGQVIRMEPRTK